MARFRRHKCKHGKKFSLNRFLKYDFTLRSRRILVVLLSIMVISITVMPSYAYFTGNLDWSSLNSGLNDLTIDNGSVDFDVDYSNAIWKKANDKTLNSYSNPSTDDTITYGPVWINQIGKKQLTSKVDLLTEYQVDKDGGSDEIANKGKDEEEDGTIEEPFEVIVGDIDNFGYTEKGDPYLDKSAKHSMEVFPQKYDAKGTDRRMVGSGFYEALKKYNSGKIHEFTPNDLYDNNGNINNEMNKKDAAFFGYKSSESYILPNNSSNNYFLYDGYTDRAIRGVNSDGTASSKDYIIDEKNWKWLQEVEPLTFKYDKITKDIKTVTFQIFTDDIQSGIAKEGDLGAFQKKSSSKYHVYLNGTEVTEFTDQINEFAQSGPRGNIVTLELPSKPEYFDIIKKAGLESGGLKLLIDDKDGLNFDEYGKDYYTGDSFAIDFAKMTVNAPATGSEADKYYGAVSGKVVDKYGKELEGVNLVAETGENVVTDENGNFNFAKLYKGLNKFTVTKEGYKKNIVYISTGEADATITLDYSAIVMQEKCQAEVVVTKCNLKGEELKDSSGNIIQKVKKSTDLNNSSYYIRKSGTIIDQAFDISFEPGCKYKIEYKVKLRSHKDLKDMQDFKLDFTINNIKVKATQENNAGWDVAGTGDNYTDKYNNSEENKTLPDNSHNNNIEENKTPPDNSQSDNKDARTTKIYFNYPDTGYYGSISDTDFYLNGKKLVGDDGEKEELAGGWWLFNFNKYNKILSSINNNKGSTVQVKNSSISEADSGELYWFTTQKVFICTN